MARISTYPVDNRIIPDDKVLGTDANGLGTKNYTFKGIADWFNATGAIAINGQNNYFFQSIPAETGRLQGTISFNSFGGVGTNFSAITTFKLAEQAVAGYTLEDYLPTLVGKEIMLAQLDDLNNFGVYNVTNIVRDTSENDFFNVALDFKQGNGALELDKFYGMSLYAGEDGGDKTYIHTQDAPSAVWVVEHNLDKFPSVSVVNNNNITVFGEVIYIDINNVRIEFSGGFSGKAYMN